MSSVNPRLHPWVEALLFVMDWQQVVAILTVLITAGLFVRARVRRSRSKSVCGTQCGCAGPAVGAPSGSVTYRARKGERPQIITRLS